MSEMFGENIVAEMAKLGLEELRAANSGTAIEAPQVEVPQVPTMEQTMSQAAERPVPSQSMEMEM